MYNNSLFRTTACETPIEHASVGRFAARLERRKGLLTAHTFLNTMAVAGLAAEALCAEDAPALALAQVEQAAGCIAAYLAEWPAHLARIGESRANSATSAPGILSGAKRSRRRPWTSRGQVSDLPGVTRRFPNSARPRPALR